MIYDDVTGGGIILPDTPGLGANIYKVFLQDCEHYSVKP